MTQKTTGQVQLARAQREYEAAGEAANLHLSMHGNVLSRGRVEILLRLTNARKALVAAVGAVS